MNAFGARCCRVIRYFIIAVIILSRGSTYGKVMPQTSLGDTHSEGRDAQLTRLVDYTADNTSKVNITKRQADCSPSTRRMPPNIRYTPHINPRPATLKLLQRSLKNFQTGSDATVTIVFKSAKPVQVRWFKDAGETFDGSEVPQMMPLEGDYCCSVNSRSSGDVTANTLTIKDFHVKMLPLGMATILTSTDGRIQFTLTTTIEEPIGSVARIDPLHSPEWDSMPAKEVAFQEGQKVEVKCEVYIPKEWEREDEIKFNELSLFQTNPYDGDIKKIKVRRIYGAHADQGSNKSANSMEFCLKDTLSVADRNSNKSPRSNCTANEKTVISSLRERLPYNHSMYSVSLTTNIASHELDAMFFCLMDRQNDKSYVAFSIFPKNNPRLLPSYNANTSFVKPALFFRPCETSMFTADIGELKIAEDASSCFRCSAYYGHLLPVTIKLEEEQTSGNWQEVVTTGQNSYFYTQNEYINVAESGSTEVTYIIRNAVPTMNKRFQCRATPKNESNAYATIYRFKITVSKGRGVGSV